MWILEKLEHGRESFAVGTVHYQNCRVVVGSEGQMVAGRKLGPQFQNSIRRLSQFWDKNTSIFCF